MKTLFAILFAAFALLSWQLYQDRQTIHRLKRLQEDMQTRFVVDYDHRLNVLEGKVDAFEVPQHGR